ncbi:TlyA family RNA methyltransferase [Candidatus Babeliales bacterium]|nr:TlyA family RNA methyltransferase [Candidatus Babeliales bacterium]MBP9843985.1 TlyA family RNA methyltransferase [Candidatus Babeliales bacterium]
MELQNNRKRLDVVIHDRRPDLSRSLIQSWIKSGFVSIAGKVVTRPGALVEEDVEFILQHQEPKFVSRSGAKLEQGLLDFKIDVTGLTVLDIGLSTGGFTDCLLQYGAAKVFGVDVGTGQVHPKIAQDSRVVVMEKTDVRNCVGKVPVVDMIVVDVSFISVTKFVDVLRQLLQPGGKLVVLIKPQFEGNPDDLARGGIVKNVATRQRIVQDVVTSLESYKFELQSCEESATVGGDGNVESLGYFIKR